MRSQILTTLKLTARVMPGKRVEFSAPELTEGDDVEIIVALPARPSGHRPPDFASAADYLDTLKPVQRTPEEWAAVERELQADKASWGH